MTDAVDAMDLDELARLEAAARERWGEDNWTIDVTLWTTGDIQAIALRSRGAVRRDEPEQYVERERLHARDDGIVSDRVIMRDESVVDVLEERTAVE